jgi:hypothetical protein
MTSHKVTVAGARGGQGTSTTAAILALLYSRVTTVELVTADTGAGAALLGASGGGEPNSVIEVIEQLAVVASESGKSDVVVVDGERLDQLDQRPCGSLLGVLRGPCYLGLRSLAQRVLEVDGIVLMAERGRSLTRRDVADVSGVDVVAEVPVTSNVARTIDAGLLVARIYRLPEFAPLRGYVNRIVATCVHDSDEATHALSDGHPVRHKSVPKIATDLPVPLNGGTD